MLRRNPSRALHSVFQRHFETRRASLKDADTRCLLHTVSCVLRRMFERQHVSLKDACLKDTCVFERHVGYILPMHWWWIGSGGSHDSDLEGTYKRSLSQYEGRALYCRCSGGGLARVSTTRMYIVIYIYIYRHDSDTESTYKRSLSVSRESFILLMHWWWIGSGIYDSDVHRDIYIYR
jgi:hypothetical protein